MFFLWNLSFLQFCVGLSHIARGEEETCTDKNRGLQTRRIGQGFQAWKKPYKWPWCKSELWAWKDCKLWPWGSLNVSCCHSWITIKMTAHELLTAVVKLYWVEKCSQRQDKLLLQYSVVSNITISFWLNPLAIFLFLLWRGSCVKEKLSFQQLIPTFFLRHLPWNHPVRFWEFYYVNTTEPSVSKIIRFSSSFCIWKIPECFQKYARQSCHARNEAAATNQTQKNMGLRNPINSILPVRFLAPGSVKHISNLCNSPRHVSAKYDQ